MCRLIGVVSTEPAPIVDLVGDDLEPFLNLACEHKDGWGLAYRNEDGAVAIAKGVDRADDSDLLRGLLKSCVTDMAVLHIRMASPNLAVRLENTHPFGDPRAAFAHNGEIRPATVLDPVIAPGLLAGAIGDTDSERYFLAVRSRIDEGAGPPEAICVTARRIRADASMSVSLNCMLLTPAGLYAYAEHDPDSEVIGRRGAGYFGLSHRQTPTGITIASQGWPQPEPRWTRIPELRVAEVPAGQTILRLH